MKKELYFWLKLLWPEDEYTFEELIEMINMTDRQVWRKISYAVDRGILLKRKEDPNDPGNRRMLYYLNRAIIIVGETNDKHSKIEKA